MIRHITGRYLCYDSGAIVIQTEGGIGFRVNIPSYSPLLNAREGDSIEVYTHMQVRDDGMSLYGFPDLEGLKLYEQLITVNGVGPKAGLSIMSLGTASQVKKLIGMRDAAGISKAQGVGKKTAERIILELAEKIGEFDEASISDTDNSSGQRIISGERTEAVLALTTLGYTNKEAEDAIGMVTDEGLSAEEYIKKALRFLM
ncbi:MAG: Holliday junction branch migration protein RuvA [Firmicutes bacterium]|nr:Holliday junction branch migration protein RuvA [Bacillota bacterium]